MPCACKGKLFSERGRVRAGQQAVTRPRTITAVTAPDPDTAANSPAAPPRPEGKLRRMGDEKTRVLHVAEGLAGKTNA